MILYNTIPPDRVSHLLFVVPENCERRRCAAGKYQLLIRRSRSDGGYRLQNTSKYYIIIIYNIYQVYGISATFHTANIFSWVGLVLHIYGEREQTARNLTQPNSPVTPYLYDDNLRTWERLRLSNTRVLRGNGKKDVSRWLVHFTFCDFVIVQ